MKSSEVKRTSDIKRSSESTVRRSVKEKKEVRKDSQPNRSKGSRKEVKKENKPKNENLIQNSRGENQEGRRAKR